MKKFLLVISLIIFSCNQTTVNNEKTKNVNSQMNKDLSIDLYDDDELDKIYTQLSTHYKTLSQKVIQSPEGYLEYPYLIPAGFYKQMWDWDGFFIGNYFASKGRPEYLKYWCLNLIKGIDSEGYVSGCATTNGPRPIFGKFSMKPFLSQGVYLSSKKMNNFNWIIPFYEKIKRVLTYREKTQRDNATGLFYWDVAMQSGADNNVAMNYFMEDKRKFLAPDISALQYKEYIAQAAIADSLGYNEDAVIYIKKAKELKEAINKYLWNNKDQIYYTMNVETRKHYKRVSYSSFVPLMMGIAEMNNGQAMINKYLLSENHMKAKYGFRTLSVEDPDYNNLNTIIPFSNWQGPVWPIANYIYSIGMKKYGFNSELKWLAGTIGTLLINDIKKYNTMHENYNADTGAALAPHDDYIDDKGNIVGFVGWNLCVENILNGVVNDKWMLLEVTTN
ncbi:hypothetical protein JM658_11835 [Joostella atrarenae]|uniref:Mannosylglycerate hydrolase MGH1-like glycoside hydrolase domain-containing protein n=1 Tax=Joostella atrarenae TaxID=679257 RepID=A0ABS9J4Z2_9FLAO|nr:alpha,alpha-trehalase [Joostella atrarenae]MCF8715516.1 hypothetical protein [Joostella atrarenae]